MRILPSLRERLGEALVQLKEQNCDLKWMEDGAFVALTVKAFEEYLARQKQTPPKQA